MAVKTTLFVEIVMERNFWLRNLRTFNINCQQIICGKLVILRQLKTAEQQLIRKHQNLNSRAVSLLKIIAPPSLKICMIVSITTILVGYEMMN